MRTSNDILYTHAHEQKDLHTACFPSIWKLQLRVLSLLAKQLYRFIFHMRLHILKQTWHIYIYIYIDVLHIKENVFIYIYTRQILNFMLYLSYLDILFLFKYTWVPLWSCWWCWQLLYKGYVILILDIISSTGSTRTLVVIFDK